MNLIAFMASGKKIRYKQETDIHYVSIFNQRLDIAYVAKQLLDSGNMDVLVLDDYTISYAPAMQPLWNNPNLASGLGLVLIHKDPDNKFQIYDSISRKGAQKCQS